MLFKNSVRTSKRTPHLTITNVNPLTLFKEIIDVYSQNRTEPINTKRRVNWLLNQLVHIITTRLWEVTTSIRSL